MKISQISSKEIEALKGKCPKCFPPTYFTDGCKCPYCKGTGKATIEIEKKKFIGLYKIKDIIEIQGLYDVNGTTFVNCIKLKIISETENSWIVVMVE